LKRDQKTVLWRQPEWSAWMWSWHV